MMRANFWMGCVGALGLGAVALAALPGCDTKAYCFANCETSSSSGTASSMTTGTGGGGGQVISTSTGFATVGSSSSGGCMLTNGGVEVCDGIDNDCNLVVDDVVGLDLNDPKTCGTCSTNCYTKLLNVDPATVQCTASPDPGTVPGTCSGTCTADYYDHDGDGSCEYYCVKSANNDAVCNNADDDCDGVFDEDVDLCTSTTDCGKCGGNCVIIHGTPKCDHPATGACTPANTQCAILACDPGYYDLDQSVATGCEYQCTPTGPELCNNGIDDDCDGKVDDADDLSGDVNIGKVCHGSPLGVCNTAAHAGVTACVSGQVQCTGANVLVPGQLQETCNNADDDCDGLTDDAPTDAGAACGVSATFPCHLGTTQCQGGMLNCVGDQGPTTETCNGQDDNCDGAIDKTGMTPPADAVGACNAPPYQSVPNSCEALGTCTPGTCMAGMKACVGGTVQCQGSIVAPPGASDACGVDTNCDGALTNQPNKMTDVANCGTCGNNCLAGAVHANWSCVAGGCQFNGCQAGYFDLNNDQKCEYACTVTGPEACNGNDDDCDGQIDEGLTAPAVASVCGVSAGNPYPECSSQVTVACTAGAWKCTFPAGVCVGGCGSSPNQEVCEDPPLDNDCDGLRNENTPNYGKGCASDDGLPPPGDGACRQTGTFICNGPTATKCSVTKANCTTLPGGCTELCDGIDNDCDGSVDEPNNAPGANSAFSYKPKVTKIAASTWVMSYEASRPSATATAPGSGNGYWTSAPSGTTLDKTPACSETGKIPWFNVTGTEVEQTCAAMGGVACSTATWQIACNATVPCKWGYSPRGAACTSVAVLSPPATAKFCNLGTTFDFDSGTTGDQDGLLPTHSPLLKSCSDDWSGQFGNTSANDQIWDMTGNLREIVKQANNSYKLMGGAFNTQSEDGAQCSFTFYSVDQNFKFFDTGFRCCFNTDPTL